MTEQTDKPVLIHGADHPITVEPTAGRVLVTAGERILADTTRALTLREANYPPVQYVPLADVDPAVLESTDHATYCPYKGDASYYSLRLGDTLADNAVWTYVAPHPAVAAIKDHLAFYPDAVTVSQQ